MCGGLHRSTYNYNQSIAFVQRSTRQVFEPTNWQQSCKYARERDRRSPVKAELFEGRSDGSGGLLEVVVGDLGEEKVVCHVPVCDVVVSVVDAPAVLAVDSLHRRRREVEVRVIERLGERG